MNTKPQVLSIEEIEDIANRVMPSFLKPSSVVYREFARHIESAVLARSAGVEAAGAAHCGWPKTECWHCHPEVKEAARAKFATAAVQANDSLISRVEDEADLCRNEGASDIAHLLDEVAAALKGKGI